jgi:hypothetical protein
MSENKQASINIPELSGILFHYVKNCKAWGETTLDINKQACAKILNMLSQTTFKCCAIFQVFAAVKLEFTFLWDVALSHRTNGDRKSESMFWPRVMYQNIVRSFETTYWYNFRYRNVAQSVETTYRYNFRYRNVAQSFETTYRFLSNHRNCPRSLKTTYYFHFNYWVSAPKSLAFLS